MTATPPGGPKFVRPGREPGTVDPTPAATGRPQFVRPRPRPLRCLLGVLATVAVIGGLAFAAVSVVAEWADYDRPQVTCAEFKVDSEFWDTRHESHAALKRTSVKDREYQAAGAVDCVLKPGMSRGEITKLFGEADELGVWSVQPDRAAGPTRHVRRWSTHRNRFFYDVMFDGFDVWFDGPEHRRVVEFRLVHESQ